MLSRIFRLDRTGPFPVSAVEQYLTGEEGTLRVATDGHDDTDAARGALDHLIRENVCPRIVAGPEILQVGVEASTYRGCLCPRLAAATARMAHASHRLSIFKYPANVRTFLPLYIAPDIPSLPLPSSCPVPPQHVQEGELFPSGCHPVDVMLRGGFREGQVTELIGPSASGKTQLCHASAAACAAQGLRVCYVDSSNQFSTSRLLDLVPSPSEGLPDPLPR